MWACQYYPLREPRHWLTSGGLGTMGYGLPAAIGAKVGCPQKEVILFVGDGSFQMTMQEMAQLMQDFIPVKVVILNNGWLGMVRQWQDLFFDQRFSHTDLTLSPDFVKLADAYGVPAARVESPKDVVKAVQTMLQHKGSYLLDVRTDETEHVFPMIPAGGSAKDMMVPQETL